MRIPGLAAPPGPAALPAGRAARGGGPQCLRTQGPGGRAPGQARPGRAQRAGLHGCRCAAPARLQLGGWAGWPVPGCLHRRFFRTRSNPLGPRASHQPASTPATSGGPPRSPAAARRPTPPSGTTPAPAPAGSGASMGRLGAGVPSFAALARHGRARAPERAAPARFAGFPKQPAQWALSTAWRSAPGAGRGA